MFLKSTFIMWEISVYYLKTNYISVILSVSSTLGWGLNFLNKMDIYPFCLNSILLSKTYNSLYNNLKMGLCKIYSYLLKLKGMGFKMLAHGKGIIFKLGYSHRILFLLQKEIKLVYIFKQLLFIKSRNIFSLKNSLFTLYDLKKNSAYNKKGLSIKGERKIIKNSSKTKP